MQPNQRSHQQIKNVNFANCNTLEMKKNSPKETIHDALNVAKENQD